MIASTPFSVPACSRSPTDLLKQIMSIRKSVVAALAKNGQCTYDDLERYTGHPRDKMRIAINDAKKSGHVVLKKDDVTGQPAYQITQEGKAWLAKNGSTEASESIAEEIKAAAEGLDHDAKPAALTIAADTSAAQIKLLELKIQALELDLKAADAQLKIWLGITGIYHITSPAELRNYLATQDNELVEAKRRANEAQERLADLEIEAAEKISSAQRELSDAILVKLEETDPVGYIVASLNKPLRRYKKPTTAQASAIASARAAGLAEVFAIYPYGKAVRGVEWKA